MADHKRISLNDLFDDLRARNEAAWNDPEATARREARSRAERDRIDAEIAAGIRDADGELDPTSEAARALYDFGDEGGDDEEYDPDAAPDDDDEDAA